MTLSKLSLRNARRQTGDYLVYFVTVTITAALLYACNGLIFSSEVQKLSSILRTLPLVIVLASIVVVCIIGWLVQYTTGFMFTKRSREFGTYILIGLENGQVARLFFLENLIVAHLPSLSAFCSAIWSFRRCGPSFWLCLAFPTPLPSLSPVKPRS